MTEMTKGLALSMELFNEHAKAELQAAFPGVFPRVAAGLVGNGSECFGYDDEISRDHDWGADFYVWLPDDLSDQIDSIQKWKKGFMGRVSGCPLRKQSQYGADPSVQTVGRFYRELIGYPQGPETAREWMSIPEENLALSVNGKVFLDNEGDFTRVRQRLERHYPEEILYKKMAARCMMMAQTGQYNLLRCHKRDDEVSAQQTVALFAQETMGMVHLLNGRYMPFYKWAFRSLNDLPLLGKEAASGIRRLYQHIPDMEEERKAREETAEELCRMVADELRHRGLTQGRDDFLVAHAEQIAKKLHDPFLCSLPLQVG